MPLCCKSDHVTLLSEVEDIKALRGQQDPQDFTPSFSRLPYLRHTGLLWEYQLGTLVSEPWPQVCLQTANLLTSLNPLLRYHLLGEAFLDTLGNITNPPSRSSAYAIPLNLFNLSLRHFYL